MRLYMGELGMHARTNGHKPYRAGFDTPPPTPRPRSSLPGMGLAGTIPADGWSLPETLTAIDLGTNAISGSLPEQWDLPASIQQIYMDGNPLIGLWYRACGSGMPRRLAPASPWRYTAQCGYAWRVRLLSALEMQSLLQPHAPLCRHTALLAGPFKPAGV